MTVHLSRLLGVVLAAAAVSSLAPAARAHDVWLTIAGPPSARRAIVNYGHPHDRPPAVADKVLDLVAISGSGQTSLLAGLAPRRAGGAPVAASRPFADDGHALLAVRYDNGYWVKIADDLYRNASRRLVPDAADSLWSVKFAKAVTGPGAPWSTVLGHELEIVPLSDPATAKPGDSLRLRVLFRGQPLAGAEVERGDGVTAVPEKDIARFTTDRDGVAAVPVVAAGPHLLVVDHRVAPSATPELAAADLYNATLWFTTARGRKPRAAYSVRARMKM